MTNYNQHSPSRWSMHKRSHAAKRRAEKAAEQFDDSHEKLAVALIGIAANYIQTAYLYDFSTEVRKFLNEHHKTELQE